MDYQTRTIREYCQSCNDYARRQGFYQDLPPNFAERLMLIVSELSEALEADRKGIHLPPDDPTSPSLIHSLYNDFSPEFPDRFKSLIRGSVEEEIADTFIRLFDLCGLYSIDIEPLIQLKMRYNNTRPYLHDKRYG